MRPIFHPTLATLLAAGRPPEWPVAYRADGSVDWQTFCQRVAARQQQWAGSPRRLLLCDADPLDFAVALLAAIAAGHTPVIPPNFQPGTLAELAKRLDDQPLPTLPGLELYTSGSSGDAKRVVKHLHQLEAECQALESLWGEALASAAVAATVPHHHIYGLLFRLLWPLLAGRAFDSVTCAEPTTLAERLKRLDASILVASPAQLTRLPELADLSQLQPHPRLVFSSGGPLAAPVAASFHAAWGAAPTEVFGSTETGGIAWRRQEDGNTTWTPLPGIDLAAAADGALLVRSPFLPDATPWRMDDAATFQPDGRFSLTGRLDRTVKIEEKRLSLPEMESRLAAHPLVREAIVVAVAGARRTVVGALIVPSAAGQALLVSGRRAITEQLRTHLAQSYDPVLLPRRWRFAEQLPYNERGKLPQASIATLFKS